MTTRNCKLVGALRVEAGTSVWVKETSAGTPIEFSITAGLWYILGDGSASDLLEFLNDAFALVFGASRLVLTLDQSTGIVTGTATVADYYADFDTGDAHDVLSWLRHEHEESSPGDGQVRYDVASPVVGYRCAAYSFYPAQYFRTDLKTYRPGAKQLIPDNGNAQTIRTAYRKNYRMGVMTEGFPRADGFNELHALEDFHDHATTGRPFRAYPDKTAALAWEASFGSASGSRYGYESMTIMPEEWDPPPENDSWYYRFRWDFEATEWIP